MPEEGQPEQGHKAVLHCDLENETGARESLLIEVIQEPNRSYGFQGMEVGVRLQQVALNPMEGGLDFETYSQRRGRSLGGDPWQPRPWPHQ